MSGDEIPIEDLQGTRPEPYRPTYYYSYPFSLAIKDNFNHKNCVCVAVTRYDNKYTGMKLIGYKIEFLKEVNRNTYKDKLDINGFQCQGLAIIESTEEDSVEIIKSLKGNPDFYVEKASDLI